MDRRPDIDEEDEQGNFKRVSNPNTVSGSVHERSDEQESLAKRLRTDGNPDSQAYTIRWVLPYPLPPEKKYLDTAISSVEGIGALAFLTDFLVVPTGVTKSSRTGRFITVTNIHVRGFIGLESQVAADDGLGNENIRIILVHDRQCNGALPVATDLLSGAAALQDYRNVENVGRFSFIHDDFYDLMHHAAGVGTDDAGVDSFRSVSCLRAFSINIKCSIRIIYDGSSGVLSERRINNLFLCIVGRQGLGALKSTAVRIRFVDQ